MQPPAALNLHQSDGARRAWVLVRHQRCPIPVALAWANDADEAGTRLEAVPVLSGSGRSESRGARAADWLPSDQRRADDGAPEREEAMARYTGGCLCGAVRYSVDAEPLPGRQLLCHCVDCQKQTG